MRRLVLFGASVLAGVALGAYVYHRRRELERELERATEPLRAFNAIRYGERNES